LGDIPEGRHAQVPSGLYNQGTLQNDYKSCEMMSDDLYIQITKKYPGRKIEIDVSEDGENGSHAVYERD
jgi:hypothetical protein